MPDTAANVGNIMDSAKFQTVGHQVEKIAIPPKVPLFAEIFGGMRPCTVIRVRHFMILANNLRSSACADA